MIATVGEFASEFLGWEAGERRSFSFTFLREGEMQIYRLSCDNRRAGECGGETREAADGM